ncbi:nucleoside triphosphate pyrophosphohydrolase [Bacillus luteolus]|uniref:Nucleoside triphosphate pyrophosphohydrolase n=1 Tax=Litchfieldia luteola TaxID=682179 RepID=A0ABR9QD94_9BACI|nr:nucleoside triphosphate pyrophosphohydrolase [Cytobacillus luteolus]MBE4906472.1 nucleoside triphosphate pyrophosphohydrolase [Cytobacillus luteolus]MBP1941155.1 putative house-cleaning noncanonical NTP pyrophosphatase (MazG superfamily) [Cytobacillus luteolus]
MPTYNKLVRDLIPTIIEKLGSKPITQILSDEEYMIELKKKSFEELEEYMNTTNKEDALEELADLLEILHALAEANGSSIDEVEMIREKKAVDRGGFKDKIFLVEVLDD